MRARSGVAAHSPGLGVRRPGSQVCFVFRAWALDQIHSLPHLRNGQKDLEFQVWAVMELSPRQGQGAGRDGGCGEKAGLAGSAPSCSLSASVPTSLDPLLACKMS